MKPVKVVDAHGALKERPILLAGRWVRAILDGRKTQTRRPIDLSRVKHRIDWVGWTGAESTWYALSAYPAGDEGSAEIEAETVIKCPFGAVGDRLWVRETWQWIRPSESADAVCYRVDSPPDSGPWRTSRFMPRWASRLDLAITDIRAEPVRSITLADAIAEGCESVDEFRSAWLEHYGAKHPWNTSWAWAITFERIGGNDG